MDTRGRTGGLKPEASSRAVWRTRLGWIHASASLALVATALSGCASLMMEKALGPNPQLYPPVVEAYEWAGRRGDELIVAYRVTRDGAGELRSASWALHPTEDPGGAESAPRQLARGAAPLQWLLLLLGVVRIH